MVTNILFMEIKYSFSKNRSIILLYNHLLFKLKTLSNLIFMWKKYILNTVKNNHNQDVDHIPEKKGEIKLKSYYLFHYSAYYEGNINIIILYCVKVNGKMDYHMDKVLHIS